VKNKRITEFMVPLAEYATVSHNATLFEAVLQLEKAQEDFSKSPYPHRAILVYDDADRVVGKISQLDILRALEPQYEQMVEKGKNIERLGFSRQFMKSLMEQYKLWDKPLDDICRKAGQKQVKDFLNPPTESEYIDEDATLDEAIHQMVMGHHQSLLVTHEKKITGILRQTDIFTAVLESMKTCNTREGIERK